MIKLPWYIDYQIMMSKLKLIKHILLHPKLLSFYKVNMDAGGILSLAFCGIIKYYEFDIEMMLIEHAIDYLEFLEQVLDEFDSESGGIRIFDI